jgi:hypothetical protein
LSTKTVTFAQGTTPMNSFLQRHVGSVIGTLSGFDRILFRGTLMRLCNGGGLFDLMRKTGYALKDFGAFCESVTKEVKAASEQVAEEAGRPLIYLASSSIRKEAVAKEIVRRDRIESGLVCVLSVVEPCWTYAFNPNGRSRGRQTRVLTPHRRKCLHHYHYMIHPELGLMHARLQTWLPLGITICLNGREWLSRQMDPAGLKYIRRENCFTQLEDVEATQELMNQQLAADWPKLLGDIARKINPAYPAVLGKHAPEYYWSVDQSEWATDVMFKNPAALANLYPRLIRHGITTLSSADVLRFLGHKIPAHGQASGTFHGQVLSDLKHRPEGLRIKHSVNSNSVKMYDKQGSVLRIETTINDAKGFKVFRPVESTRGVDESGQETCKQAWQPLRKGVADLHRRAQVSDASNERYLEAMAVVEHNARLGEILEPVCKPARLKTKPVRPLRPFDPVDQKLLESIGRGEFAINGLRNRDIRQLMFGNQEKIDAKEKRRRSGIVTRLLRLLRAHHLISKVPRTHRYQITPTGRRVVTSLATARQADTAKLLAVAA